jgi:hypothetical protein
VRYAERAAAGLPPGSLRTRIADCERDWAAADARRLLAVAMLSRDAGQLQVAVQAARDLGLPGRRRRRRSECCATAGASRGSRVWRRGCAVACGTSLDNMQLWQCMLLE